MAKFPWNQREEINGQHNYMVMASLLPLKKHRSIPGFLRDTLAIRRQLRNAPGLVGYALLAELTKKTFWTYSVWSDRESLNAFASSNPHAQIIRRLRPNMGETVFNFVEVTGTGLPWAWKEVKIRLTTKS